MCRSSPQFGVTLVTYELLQQWFYIDFGGQYVDLSNYYYLFFVKEEVVNLFCDEGLKRYR